MRLVVGVVVCFAGCGGVTEVCFMVRVVVGPWVLWTSISTSLVFPFGRSYVRVVVRIFSCDPPSVRVSVICVPAVFMDTMNLAMSSPRFARSKVTLSEVVLMFVIFAVLLSLAWCWSACCLCMLFCDICLSCAVSSAPMVMSPFPLR